MVCIFNLGDDWLTASALLIGAYKVIVSKLLICNDFFTFSWVYNQCGVNEAKTKAVCLHKIWRILKVNNMEFVVFGFTRIGRIIYLLLNKYWPVTTFATTMTSPRTNQKLYMNQRSTTVHEPAVYNCTWTSGVQLYSFI